MTLAAPAPTSSLRRLQGGLVVCGLVAAVVATGALVAPGVSTTVSSAAATSATSAATRPVALPVGLRVSVEGGDPFVAYRLGDRLTGLGAVLGGVQPAATKDAVAPTTTIVYYDTRSMAAAASIRAMLGTGTLRRQRVFQPPVDVTIVLGKDLARP